MGCLLANADIVFDGTLSRVERSAFQDGKVAFVISVSTPANNSDYFTLFDSECPTEARCTLGIYNGWWGAGGSWDAYLFQAPIPFKEENLKSMEYVMNVKGAENRAGYLIEVGAKVKLYNPCFTCTRSIGIAK